MVFFFLKMLWTSPNFERKLFILVPRTSCPISPVRTWHDIEGASTLTKPTMYTYYDDLEQEFFVLVKAAIWCWIKSGPLGFLVRFGHFVVTAKKGI